jgi:hypothetical protein
MKKDQTFNDYANDFKYRLVELGDHGMTRKLTDEELRNTFISGLRGPNSEEKHKD